MRRADSPTVTGLVWLLSTLACPARGLTDRAVTGTPSLAVTVGSRAQ